MPPLLFAAAKAQLPLGSLRSRRLLLVTNQARRTEVRTNPTGKGGGGERERRKIKREREKAALIIG